MHTQNRVSSLEVSDLKVLGVDVDYKAHREHSTNITVEAGGFVPTIADLDTARLPQQAVLCASSISKKKAKQILADASLTNEEKKAALRGGEDQRFRVATQVMTPAMASGVFCSMATLQAQVLLLTQILQRLHPNEEWIYHAATFGAPCNKDARLAAAALEAIRFTETHDTDETPLQAYTRMLEEIEGDVPKPAGKKRGRKAKSAEVVETAPAPMRPPPMPVEQQQRHNSVQSVAATATKAQNFIVAAAATLPMPEASVFASPERVTGEWLPSPWQVAAPEMPSPIGEEEPPLVSEQLVTAAALRTAISVLEEDYDLNADWEIDDDDNKVTPSPLEPLDILAGAASGSPHARVSTPIIATAGAVPKCLFPASAIAVASNNNDNKPVPWTARVVEPDVASAMYSMFVEAVPTAPLRDDEPRKKRDRTSSARKGEYDPRQGGKKPASVTKQLRMEAPDGLIYDDGILEDKAARARVNELIKARVIDRVSLDSALQILTNRSDARHAPIGADLPFMRNLYAKLGRALPEQDRARKYALDTDNIM